MAAADDPRSGEAWMQILALCKQVYPWTCHLCGQAIPRDLPPGHKLRYEADHVKTVREARWLARDIHNLRPSHRQCNEYRRARPLTPGLIAEITARFAKPTPPALSFFNTEREGGGGSSDSATFVSRRSPSSDDSPRES